jgi:hypothetical protein
MIQIRLGLPHRPGRVIEAELPHLGCFGFPRCGCVEHVGGEVGLDDLVATSLSSALWLRT